jgi:hypothetical protein
MGQVFRVTMPEGGDFPSGKAEWDLLKMTGSHADYLPDIVDLSECAHLRPYSLACLAAIGMKSQGKIQLILPSNEECMAQVIRLGLHQWFTVPSFPQVEIRATDVPIRRLYNAPGTFADDAMIAWEAALGGLLPGVRPALSNHLDEMIFNALGHSKSPVGCFAAGQAFPAEMAIEMAVVDLGVTIRSHLSANPAHQGLQSDEQAIRAAFVEGVTGTVPGGTNLLGQPNSGVGLTNVVRFCQSGGGIVTVISGTACISIGPTLDVSRILPDRFQGTLVNLRFVAGIA